MGNVIFIISVLFLETLTAAAAVMVCFMLAREWFRRRQTHLLLFSIAFLAMAVSYASVFSGQLLSAVNDGGVSKLLTLGFQYAAMVEGAFLIFGVANIRMRGGLRMFSVLLAFAAVAVSGYSMFFGPQSLYFLTQSSNDGLAPLQYLLNFSSLFVASIVLVLPVLTNRGERAPGAIDSYFARAGALLFAVVMLRFLAIYADAGWLIIVGSVTHLAFMSYLTLASLAYGSPDPMNAKDPSRYFRKRLLYKAVGMNSLLFWFLAYLLLTITSVYFVNAAVESRHIGLRRDVHFFSRTFAANGVLFLEETSRLAEVPSIETLIGADAASIPPSIADFLRGNGRQRILRIADNNGVVVFSSFDRDEVGSNLDSAVLRKAIAGKRIAATEKESAINAWAVRAAVPLTFSDGTVGGVVLTTDLSSALDFSDYTAIAPVLASGYGYVTQGGESAYAYGDQPDEITKKEFVRLLGGQKTFNGKLGSDDDIFLEHTYATDGSANGFFYVLLRHALVERDTFRIIAVVVVLMQMALAIIVAVLLFSMALVLRPIRELQTAVRRVEKDEYDVHLEARSPDELGELAGAFTHMSATIAERTTKLRDTLREQQDFLEHSVRDMRTPINIFRWTLELMRFGDTGKLNRQQLEFLEQMYQTNERLVRMVQNMQDVSLLDRGKFMLKIEPFRIEDVIDEAAGELAVIIRERNINLHWKHPPMPFPSARGDRNAVKKAILNLLSNAIKYNQDNGHIEIGLSQRKRADADGGGTVIDFIIEDSGRGIPKDEQARVFTRYFRARNVIAEEIEGAGLGLYIVKKLVDLQGGTIGFEAKESIGCTFHMAIPADIPR